MFLLGGVPRYLFVPLAEAVVFAMLASYFLSRTLVPTLAMYLLKAQHHGIVGSRNPFIRFQQAFERGFERLRLAYQRLLTTLVHRPLHLHPGVSAELSRRLSLGALAGAGFLPEHR
jgi:multidrug efflux pump subunit AcrB